MTKRLKIMIGPNREEMQIAHVNDSSRPTIIDSEFFVGRVLIKIRDFEGITPDGSPPIRNHVYFDGRSRKFDIQIEGRFKRRKGVDLYSGEEVHFGSDFDHIVDFPKSAFNAGMRVARWIDPNVFYDLTPPSERPFIMSPYLACMNTLCAWPCPDRLRDALVCLRQSDREEDHHLNIEAADMVPMEQVDPDEIGATAGKKKIGRHPRPYWRFIGLKGDHGRIDAFIEKNKHLLAEPLEDQNHPQPEHDDLPTELPTTANENDEYDDTDAVSCRAPSSHATYSTALEGSGDYRLPPTSASSYRFSPRIFPRHQISFGAGMRDIYQDAEIEANVREGEARATRMVEMMGEDDSMPLQRPPPIPETPQPGPDHESDEGVKKSSSKVKHSLKKLKTAFKKMTPSLSSTSASSSPHSGSINKRKSYSTAFMNGKARDSTAEPTPVTVSRAASRTLPAPIQRDSSQSLRNDASSPEKLNLLTRSSSLMPRPKSHHPPTNSSSDLQPNHSKARSTSLDQSRPFDLSTPMSLLKESNLFTIHQGVGNQTEASSPRPGSSRLSIVRSEREESRVSSPSTIHSIYNQTGDTSPSPDRREGGHEESKFTELPEPTKLTINPQILEHDAQAETSPTAMTSDTEASHDPVLPRNRPPPVATSYSTLMPSGGGNKSLDATSSTSLSLAASDASAETISKSQTQMSQTPSQAEIHEAPELEDVEVGDLMLANMLKLASDSSDNQDPVQGQLGPWRFKNPTTDILEDNTFVFLNKSVNVQKRRKYFSESNGKYRKAFTYDPDVVYATSFFSPFMDFNTFDLAIGPVKINVAKVFGDMPVRYTLRSTRIDESNGKKEEEIFVTISFELVDDDA